MDPTHPETRPVIVLGAGINGAALARELVLNRVPVWLVDTADIAAGTTAYSSRLIHGGLRYLEYGEFDLVRESLEERTRLLKLAPQFVRPWRLYIPVSNRFGGLKTSALRFFGLERQTTVTKSRGAWLVQIGLSLYDRYARDPGWPPHRVESTGADDQPVIDGRRFPWVCSYSDGQVAFPERFTLALVEDARRIAAENGTGFGLWTYHRAVLDGSWLGLFPVDPVRPFDAPSTAAVARSQPALIVNATGAWVDRTLAQLGVHSKDLLQGTKGTHLFTHAPRLRERLRGQGIYGEAPDGRPVFILPLAGGTLIGTTDERFSGPPEEAVATEREVEYLLDLVNMIVPDVNLRRQDLAWQAAGVRPLPRAESGPTASITRRHFLVENFGCPVPLLSLVGGKLTTCRSLAEEAAGQVLKRLGIPQTAHSRHRFLPGGEAYPSDSELPSRFATLANRHGLSPDQVSAIWSLCGTRTDGILASIPDLSGDSLSGTPYPKAFVRWVIEHEWVHSIEDLVERRLMLLFQPIGRETLRDLAQLLAESGRLEASGIDMAVEHCAERLRTHFGMTLQP